MTEVDARYAEGVRRLKEARDTLLAQVTGGQDVPTGRLRVSAPTDFGALFVAPVLSDLIATYPELMIDLRLASAFTDLLAEEIDVAIRIGELADSSLTARKIGISRRVLVAFPKLASSIKQPEGLESTEMLSYQYGLTERRLRFGYGGTDYEFRLPCRFGVNSMTAVRDAVLSGLGIHLGPEWAYKNDIAAGRLMRILPDADFSPFPIHAVWQPTPFQPASARELVKSMVEKLRGGGLV